MTLKTPRPVAGLTMVLLSFLGGGYIAWFLWRGLSLGFVPGRLGAIHYAWSANYIVSMAGCVLGLVFCISLTIMGWRFAGLIHWGKDKRQ
jgi:hypothetical protein